MKNVRNVLWMMILAAGLSQAVTVEFVTDSVVGDQSWIDLLTNAGYTVNSVGGQYATLDATKIATLNAADLVIISRRCASGSYDDGTEVTDWNNLTSPVLNLNAFLARSSRWKWLNATERGDSIEPLLAIVPSDSIFLGVPLDAAYQVNVIASDNCDLVRPVSIVNGTLLATRPSDQAIWIAQWNTGVEYYPGAAQYAGGPRVFFGAGTDVAGVNGMNLNVAGQLLFLNIVYGVSGATFDRPPIALAGNDKIIYLGDTAQLNGSAIDPEGSLTTAWSQASGPGTATFGDSSAPATTVAFDAAGTYALKLDANDGTNSSSDTVIIYVRDHADDVLIAHWDFESLPDPNTLIDVANGFDGTYHKTVPGDPNTVAGHIAGSALAANLLELSYWEIPTALSAVEPNFNDAKLGLSVAAWVRAETPVTNAFPAIMGFGLDGWRFQAYNNQWNFAYGNTVAEVRGLRGVYDPPWHHVVAMYDGPNAQFKLYVDGAFDASVNVPSGLLLNPGADVLRVGNRGGNIRIWPGQIDDIRVYNYALSEAEIAALTSAGDVPPYLTAGTDQTVQYKGIPVQLDATRIVDDGVPGLMTLSWAATTVPAGVDPATVVFNDPAIEDPAVMFPNVAGTYTFTLTGNDGAVECSDQVSVVILIPTCADVLTDGLGYAADLSGPAGVPDCYINIYDLTAMSADWLNCNNPEDATCAWPY